MANKKAIEVRKGYKVMLTSAEHELCLRASSLENMNGYSAWARKVLLEAADATSRGVRR